MPTRTMRFTPSIASSSITIAADGQPMPLAWTDTGLPLERAGEAEHAALAVHLARRRRRTSRRCTSPAAGRRGGGRPRRSRRARHEGGSARAPYFHTDAEAVPGVRAAPGGGPRLLRRGARRARLPRGRGAAWPGPVRGHGGESGLDGAVPRRRERRSVGHGLRGVRAGAQVGTRPDDHRRGAGRRRAVGARRKESSVRRASTGPDSPSTCSTSRPRTATRSCARRRPPISTCSSRRAPRRTRTRSASIRSRTTPTAFAGGRAPRSAKAARGCGPRTARSSSRPRRPPGRRTPSSSSRSGSTRLARGQGLRPARHARPLPPAARAGAARLPLRPRRERAGDSRLRGDRHAPHDLVPQPHLLTGLGGLTSATPAGKGVP